MTTNVRRVAAICLSGLLLAALCFVTYTYIVRKCTNSLRYVLTHEWSVGIYHPIPAVNGQVILQHLGARMCLTDPTANDATCQMLRLLRHSSGFHSAPISAAHDYLIMVALNMDVPEHIYKYDVVSGELGSDHDWCFPPKEFQTWMRSIDRRVQQGARASEW